MSLLMCPHCGAPLDNGVPTRRCANGHCFDRAAKGGYIHLLRQTRRGSSNPGDSPEMCRMRTQFLEGGYYACLRERVAAEAAALAPRAIVDAGCGEGYYTAAIAEACPTAEIAGIDLAKAALRHAGRVCPRGEFAVASLFELPVADGTADLVTHLFAPLCEGEFARVLRPGGTLLTVTPGARHLWGLKERLYEKPYENETDIRAIAGFVFERRVQVDSTIAVTNAADIEALFRMTPYAWKTGKEASERLLQSDRLDTEISFLLDLYRKEEPS